MKTAFTTNTERGKPSPRHLKEYGRGVNYHECRKRDAELRLLKEYGCGGIFILGLTNSGVRHVYKESTGIREGSVDTRERERIRGEREKVMYAYGEKWGV